MKKAWNDYKLSRFSFLYGYTRYWGLGSCGENGDTSNINEKLTTIQNL
jgi:hypothetical protein